MRVEARDAMVHGNGSGSGGDDAASARQPSLPHLCASAKMGTSRFAMRTTSRKSMLEQKLTMASPKVSTSTATTCAAPTARRPRATMSTSSSW